MQSCLRLGVCLLRGIGLISGNAAVVPLLQLPHGLIATDVWNPSDLKE